MAYKQNFGKPSSKGDGQTFQDNGLVSPMHMDAAKSTNPNIKTGNIPKVGGIVK
jgi:hypothetical protein